MEKRHYIGKGIFALLVAAATLAGCSKDSDNNDNPTPPVIQDPYKEWPIKPKIKEGEASYISFYIPTGEDSSTDFYIKGNGWMDLNNNGVQDPDEKTEVFDGTEKSYTIKSQVCTLYGIISSFSISAGFGMKGLDVSHAPALQELLVNEQELTELNLRENKALSRLVMHSNYIKKLDLRENKKLTVLDATSNELEELNLSENKELTELYVYNNQLSALDLRENKALTTLEVNNNQLSTLELSTDTQLKDVDLLGNKLGEEVMLKIVENLPQRDNADKGTIFLQTFKILGEKQVAENNKVNKEISKKLYAKKWTALFINKEGYHREYNGNPNTPHENP